ncbi:nicotinate-nucleotide--dimethylbenzimidazole phosphoribosyltransferase [Streptomyces sp. NPDC052301]|uniref:nicotinate-nucleotide--dimethylbenzimidazole phosphoribosyltransferase n=1 Tax=Streptomyces sp. NPDC052301 TaxID=3365687 RepID=UPI0037D64317
MTDTGQVPGDGQPESAGMVEQPGAPAHGAYTYLSEAPAEDEDLLLPGAQGAWGNEVPPPAPEPVVEAVHEPGPHETAGRDSGSVDLSGVRLPNPAPASVPPSPILSAPHDLTGAPQQPRRPLHLGPPIPDASASPVRSLADRGPAGAPVRQPGPAPAGPEYLDAQPLRETAPQTATPWGAAPTATAQVSAQVPAAETVDPSVVPAAVPEPADVTPAVAVSEPVDVTPAVAVADPIVAATPVAATDPGEAVAPSADHIDPSDAAQAAVARLATQAAAGTTQLVHGHDGVQPAQGHDGVYVGPEGTYAPSAQPAAEAEQAPLNPEDAPGGQPIAAEAPTAAEPERTVVPEAVVEQPAVAEAAQPGEGPEQGVGPEFADAGQVPAGADGAAAAQDASLRADAVPAEGLPDAVAVQGVAEAAPGAGAPEAVPAQAVPEAAPMQTAPDAEAAQRMAEAAAPTAEAVPAPNVVQAPETAHASEAAQAPAAEAPAAEAPAAQAPEAVQVPEAAQAVDAGPAPETVQTAPEAVQNADALQAPEAAQLTDAGPAPEPAEAPESVAPASAPVAGEAEAAAVAPAEAAVLVRAPVDGTAEPVAPTAEGVPGAPQPQPQPEPAAVQDAVRQPAQVAPAADAAPVAAPAAPVDPQAQPAEAASVPAAAEAAPASAEAPGQQATDGAGVPLPSHVSLEPAAQQPLGQFVPVDGQVPTTPHLAPTPPQPLVLPAEITQDVSAVQGPQDPQEPQMAQASQEPQVAQEPHGPQVPQGPQGPQTQPEPVATVPAPREAEPDLVPPAPDAEHTPDVVQHAEDLQTRAADQEESTADVAEAQQSTGPAAPGYADAEREAVLKVMRERRDIRNGFRSDPIPHEVLLRVLEAAHTAPSVGHSQPWDFVVIRSAETRRTMHELAMRQREAYAKSLPKGRAKQFKELKIEAILDTPVNIVVTADPTRGGRHTLGRHTQPQMAPYSSALAVENLWLAARAEGLGVGWVSFFDEREMVRTLGLPEHLEVVAYLCVGYVDEFPDEPELMQAGWSKRRPLSWVVHEETYGRRALPGEEPHDLLAETVAQIRPLDAKALGEAWERQKRMTKPAGALGMLEIISAQLSGLSRQCPPPIPEPAAVAIFAGDHGVHAQGVTPWPQEVTAQMVANFLGGGAVCNAFATQVGAEVCVVDVGVAADLPATPGLLPRKIRGGTSDMTTGPAMSREEAKAAIEVGIETARDLVAAGNKALLTGEMGIANTTASAALISVFTGADPAEVTGRGTGINDETLARKTEVVRRALELHQPDPADPIGVLAAIGGFEHAAMVGLLLGGASLRTPVILDGVSAGAAALVARAIAPEVLAACIAGHRSAEPGHVAALNKLGLRPLVDLDLRLGEGTGALLALPLVQSTARAMHEVATFDSAGVTEK